MEKVPGWRPIDNGAWVRGDGARVEPIGDRWRVVNGRREIATDEKGETLTFDTAVAARNAVDYGRVPKALGILPRFEE